MADRFEIGETVYFIGSLMKFTPPAQDCVITGPLHLYKRTVDGMTLKTHGYSVRMRDGEWVVAPSLLRKKRPPAELGSWSAIASIWKPRKVSA